MWSRPDRSPTEPRTERWVRARNESEDVKIFVTGSSASLMSRELATLLTGRHVTFPVFPLSFVELLHFRGIRPPARPRLAGAPPRLQNALRDYVLWGGFPEVVLEESEQRRHTLLKTYFDDLLYKDVALRHRVRDMQALRALAVHLLAQTANLVSLQRTARTFGVSLDLARTYLGHLQEAYLVESLPYYSLKVTERQRHPQKVHAVDLGLRNAVCLSETPDRGRLAETSVTSALRRDPDNDLFYWKADGEVDLLVRRGNRVKALVQVVCEGLDDEASAVRKRETAPFAAGRAAYPEARCVLVVGRGVGPDLPDVDVMPLWRLLLEGLSWSV